MNSYKNKLDRFKAVQEMEELILKCLLSNGYETKEALITTNKMIDFFSHLENERIEQCHM
jgi:hypothetical protein